MNIYHDNIQNTSQAYMYIQYITVKNDEDKRRTARGLVQTKFCSKEIQVCRLDVLTQLLIDFNSCNDY